MRVRRGQGLRALALCLALVVAIVAAPSRARAAGAQADLEGAETAYAEVDYEKANKLAADVLAQRGLTRDQLVRAYRVLARTHAVLDHDKEARAAFVVLLTLSPDEREDRAMPPKINDRIAEARGVLSGYPGKPGIDLTAVVRAREGGTLRVTTRDPTHLVKRIVVAWRWGAAGAFTTTDVAIGEASIDVPAPPPNVTRLDYFAQAYDERDGAVFEVGSAAAPKTATAALPAPGEPPPKRAPTERRRSVFASPTFLGIAGGVIVAGAILGFALTRPGSATSVTMSPALVCGAARCN